MIIQKYNLNLIPEQVPLFVRVSQYDKQSRQIDMSLWNGSQSYSIPNGATVTVRGTKKDNTGFEYACTVNDNVASFIIEAQQTIFDGKVLCELRITSGDEILGTCNFYIEVEKTPLDESTVISETELPLLEEAVEASAQAKKSADRAESAKDEILAQKFVKSVNGAEPGTDGNVTVQTSSPLSAGTGIQIANDVVTNTAPMFVDELGAYSGATPINADMLDGHDTSYFAKATDYSTLAGNFAQIETSPSTSNHSVGEYIVYDSQLYEVISAITTGASLVVGTNIQATTVADSMPPNPYVSIGAITATNESNFVSAFFQKLIGTDNGTKMFSVTWQSVSIYTGFYYKMSDTRIIAQLFPQIQNKNEVLFVSYESGTSYIKRVTAV